MVDPSAIKYIRNAMYISAEKSSLDLFIHSPVDSSPFELRMDLSFGLYSHGVVQDPPLRIAWRLVANNIDMAKDIRTTVKLVPHVECNIKHIWLHKDLQKAYL